MSLEVEDIYPLAPMQQGMLFHSLLDPESGVYVEQISCVLRGDLSLPAFAEAWRRAIDRHSILRTAFVWEELDEPLQVVQPAVELPLAVEDWRELDAPAQRERLDALLAAERAAGFDLSAAPLMRLHLARLADERYQLSWTHHHLLFDGWSLPLLLGDVLGHYEALRLGREPELPRPRPYRDYIAWLQEQDAAAAEAYWREALAGFSAPTPLVASYATGAAPGNLVVRGQLAPEATAELQSLARRHELTLNTIVQGAWALLLHRYSDEDDIVFGATVSGRPADLAGAELMVGLFINTLPVRVRIDPARPALALLRELQRRQAEQRQYEHTPLVQIQAWSEVPADQPLFESILVFENYPVDEALGEQAGSVQITDVESFSQTNYPLTLAVSPGRALSLELSYDPRRLDTATAERLLGHFQTLIGGLLADIERPVVTLPLLSEAERRQLAAWNDTAAPYPEELCVHELFAAQVAREPGALALIGGGAALSYGELDEQANQLAHHLRGLGVGPEVLVGICLRRSPELVVAALGVLKAGGAYLPIDPDYPAEQIQLMVEDARPPVLLTSTAVVEGPSGAAAAGVGAVVRLDADRPRIAALPATAPASGALPDNLAYVIYTSGSTGRPKGVLLHHRGLCNFVGAQAEAWRIGPGSRVLQLASFSFDGSVAEIFTTLCAGGTVCLAPPGKVEAAAALAQVVNELQVSHLSAPPSLLALLAPDEVPTLSTVAAVGEACPTTLAAAWLPGRRFINGYGPTETTIGATYHVAEPAPADSPLVPIGRPFANVQVHLLDHHRRPVPVGVPGELYIGGVGVARGYLNRPELTAERFVELELPEPGLVSPVSGLQSPVSGLRSRLYRTGDRAYCRPDGALVYLGRADQQIKLRGFRIEPGEIESALRAHPDVGDALVMLREDRPGDQRLVAYVTTTDHGPGTTDARTNTALPAPAHLSELPRALRDHLSGAVPAHMVPAAFVIIEAWPLTPNGKVDRRALPAPDGSRAAGEGFAAPRTAAEELLASIFARVLGLERVGIDENFFQLGGHSLLATQLISRVRDAFAVELPFRTFFEAPTVSELAARLGDELRPEVPPLAKLTRSVIARLPRGGELPLSFAQQRLWFLDQLEPGTVFNNMPSAMRLSGALDVAALKASLAEITRRHETLRASFDCVDGRPVQVIAPPVAPADFPLPLTDLSALPAEEREAEALRLAREEARRPFDLARGPLLRAQLLRLADHEHVALLTMHHIAFDGWSMGVFVGELAALYAAFAAGQPGDPQIAPISGPLPASPDGAAALDGAAAGPDDASAREATTILPELPVQYADFAAWQRGWLQGEALERQLDYWTGQLAEVPALLDLPTDRPRPAVQSFAGATYSFALPAELSAELKTLAQEENSTLFITLLAGFQTLLARYSGQERFAVGTPIANRTRAELEPLIGFFANTLALTADLRGAPSFRELLRRVRETALGAYAHQDLPFEMLVEAVQPERSLAHAPIFQVMFVMDNQPLAARELPGLTITSLDVTSGMSSFDMTLSMSEGGGTLHGSLEYNTDLFDAATIERLVGHLATLLAAAVADPDQPVAELPLLTPAERELLLHGWNQTDTPFPADACIHERIARWATEQPDHPALRSGGAAVSYAQLDARSSQLAHALRRRGVGPDSIVAIALPRTPDLIVAILGTLKAGGAFLPLDLAYPAERLRFMLEDARPTVLITSADGAASLLPDGLTLPTLDPADPALAQEPASPPASGVTAEHLAYVIYTSGSTGTPKGTLLAHRGLVNLAAWQARAFGITPASRVLQFAALSFDAAVWELVMALANGATLVLAAPEQLVPGTPLRALLQSERVSIATLPPSLLAVLDPADLPELTTIVAAGEASSQALVQRWSAGRQYVNAYGPTETTVCASWHVCDPAAAGPPPIGRPIANTRLYVLDPQQQPVPIGVPGELYVGGVGVARGYLGRPELTAERFVELELPVSSLRSPLSALRSRLYRTGDRVRYRADGNIEFLGRLDHQIKLRGFRVEPEEVAAALRAHPAVADAMVLVQGSGSSARLVGYVVPRDASSLAEGGLAAELAAELGEQLRARLPEYMVPAALVGLAAWPLTPSGKVDRAALPAPGREAAVRAAYEAPVGPTEELLAGLAAELLEVEQVGRGDNFFALGGHSLLATQLVARVRAQWGVELPLRALFEQPTIAGLAEQIERQVAEQRAGPPAAQPAPITRVARESRRMKRSELEPEQTGKVEA